MGDNRLQIRLPQGLRRRLFAYAEAHGSTRSDAARALNEASLDSAKKASTAPKPPARRRPVLKEVRKIMRRRRKAAPDDLMALLELTQALMSDLLAQTALDLNAIEAWERDGGQAPACLTDPTEAIPIVAECRKLVAAIEKNRLTRALTAGQVFHLFREFGEVVRLAVGDSLGSIAPAQAGEIQELVMERCNEGWERIERDLDR